MTCSIDRRSFLAGAVAVSACGASPLFAAGMMPRLKVGILSDVHASRKDAVDAFVMALKDFRKREVDAVLITGDLCTWGSYAELKTVADAWFGVFPNDRLPNGTRVERLFLTGNHDTDGFAYEGARYWCKSVEDAQRNGFFFNRSKFWKELFGEKYEPICCKEVKGYKFVLRHWVSRVGHEYGKTPLCSGLKDDPSPVADWFAKHGTSLPIDRPFFYCQHEHPLGTCSSPYVYANQDGDDGVSTKILSKYPNAVAFSGHSHFSLVENRTIWQGAFTSVGCSSSSGYAFTFRGRENGHAGDDGQLPTKEMPPVPFQRCHQGMYMEVFDDRIVLERIDLLSHLRLGPDWVIPLGPRPARPYRPDTLASASKAPQFAADAKIAMRHIAAGEDRKGMSHPQIEVSFPPVNGLKGGSRALDFEVTVEQITDDVTKMVAMKRVYSPNSLFPAEFDIHPVTCRFAANAIPNRGDILFSVTPLNEWGKRGRPLTMRARAPL